MAILPTKTSYRIFLRDGNKCIDLPVSGIEIINIPSANSHIDLGHHNMPTMIDCEFTCRVDFNQLVRSVLAGYPEFERYLREALSQVESAREAAKEQRERDMYKIREAYRAEKAKIDARADELNELVAILAGVHLPPAPEHVNCKATEAEAK